MKQQPVYPKPTVPVFVLEPLDYIFALLLDLAYQRAHERFFVVHSLDKKVLVRNPPAADGPAVFQRVDGAKDDQRGIIIVAGQSANQGDAMHAAGHLKSVALARQRGTDSFRLLAVFG